jgi:hypothetical protein
MKNFEEFTQLEVALMTASCLVFGAVVPTEMPLWDGKNIDAFFAVKEEFSPTLTYGLDDTDGPHFFAKSVSPHTQVRWIKKGIK